MPSEILPTPVSDIKPPRCAMCRTRMAFKHREVDTITGEKLTFQCPKCEFTKTKLSGDAVGARRQRIPAKQSRRPAVR